MKRKSDGLIMIFVDGLGLGPGDPTTNPLARFKPRALTAIDGHPPLYQGRVLATRTDMGIEGTPQSATNQTSLFTGVNGPKLLGRHLSAFPNRRLREIVREKSIMRRLRDAGRTTAFANAYSPPFFSKRPRWVSVTTVMCESAGVRLRTFDDLRLGRALYMDYTNRLLREQGLDIPSRSPDQAGRLLAQLARDYDFCLYEYFLTDLVGHRGTIQEATRLLRDLDTFVAALLDQVDSGCSVLLTSDHGNIESMDHARHTHNRVPTFLWGPIGSLAPDSDQFSLTDISHLIEMYLTEPRP